MWRNVMTLSHDDLVAVYPASPIFEINNAKVNIIENLKRFKDSLIESLKRVLRNERIVFIRMAHVGMRPRKVNSRYLPCCKEIYSQNQQCVFIPIEETESSKRLYSYVEVVGAHRESEIIPARKLRFLGFHADPLIYAKHKPNRRAVLSLTYGENDVEPMLIWLEIPSQLKIDVSKIDAYVLFNTTYLIFDYREKLQFMHGGFKAEAWDYIQCFREDYRQQPNECFDYFNSYVRMQEVRERLTLNPHWLRGEQNGDPRRDGTILMILGDKDKWFFSLPIAPQPLYYLAQGPKKTEISKRIVRKFFGEENCNIIDSKVDDIKSLLSIDENMVKDLRNLVKDYYNGYAKLTNELCKYINFATKSLRGYREMKAIKSLEEYGITPQFRGNVIYSYLDAILSYNTSSCKLAWIWVLLVVLLMDIYVDRFEKIFV